MIIIGENTIRKARRFRMFNLSTFDFLSKEERALYNAYQECGSKNSRKEDKQILRKMYEEKIAESTDVREIPTTNIFSDNRDPKIEKTIAGFENECVRLSESLVYDANDPKNIPFINEIIIIDCCHEEILEQILNRGAIIAGEKYVFYSSSANQQKNKQVCLMQEKFFKENEYHLMCGLTLDVINETIVNSKGQKGCNVGKYLAYTSLIFSKSVESPAEIDIDGILVLPEFETSVFTKVNFLDMDALTIEEKEMSVPVNHTDGAGLFLPGVLPQSAQIRGGWIKGCIFPFDFRQFIIEKQAEGKILPNVTIKDAWGKDVPIDYIKDNIKVILNTSQLKMWKYYESWDEYKECFKNNGLKICINNTMHYPDSDDPIVLSAYQFYQTIPRKNVTDDKIEKISELTIELINGAKTNPDTALKIMGVDLKSEDNKELDPFYAAIKSYPQMLQDAHVKKRIESYIEAQREKAMAGKPYIRGFYNYICPDLYAACEYWFCDDKEPKGLIPKDCVYNVFYNDREDVSEVCCLRSPHLSDCEHGIKNLVKSKECKRWFHGMDTVISTHDLLTKTLQCDVDGDEMLLTHDKCFIDLLDRDKLPLYYEMPKADPSEINTKNILNCLHKSFENSIIGNISNALTKHLNLKGEPDLTFVRIMTAYNNFCIDYPKSGYMPSLGKYQEIFEKLCKKNEYLYPYFFQYAKPDKNSDDCYEYGDKDEMSNINRISRYIQKKTAKNTDNIWKKKEVKEEEEKFNPQYFQFPEEVVKVKRSSDTYIELQKKMYELKGKDTRRHKDKLLDKLIDKHISDKNGKFLAYDAYYYYCSHEILEVVEKYYNIAEGIGIRKKAAAYLLDIEYYQRENVNSNKDILWNCFGDILYENLKENLKLDNPIKIKKTAPQSSQLRDKKIADIVAQTEKDMDREYQIDIFEDEYNWINSLKCRKNCVHDKHLLYLLLVQYKRKLQYLSERGDSDVITEDNLKHFRVYVNAKSGNRITKNTLDKWMDATVSERGLQRLLKKGIIKIQKCKKYYKIYLQIPFEISKDFERQKLFTVGGGNPMMYYYQYSKEYTIKNCEICGKLFIANGNAKTCSVEHSELLKLRNKNI